jgi:hypothetical protein
MSQYLRSIELKIGDDQGQGLDFSGLRIQFAISKKDSTSPNSALITVYNVTQSTIAQIQKEFTRVTLAAGYGDTCALIFNGTITQSVYSTQGGVDGVLQIAAGDGDVAHNFAVVNKTLAAGATQTDVFQSALSEYDKKGVGKGFIDGQVSGALPRGKVMYGMAREYLTSSAKNSKMKFSVQDGKAQLLKDNGALPDTAYVLNSQTGLVGSPSQTTDGIQGCCLLNPQLRIGSVVQINQKDVTQQISDSGESTALAADGFYRLISVEFNGDTHGGEWYCDFVGVAMDNTQSKTVD